MDTNVLLLGTLKKTASPPSRFFLFYSNIRKLMQQIPVNNDYTHTANYKEKYPKNTFKKHEAKKQLKEF